jgi:hypothetical protein
MPARPLVLAIAIYVGLDLTNPFMPGAFIFDPEQTVEGLRSERSGPPVAAPTAPAAPRVGLPAARSAPLRPSAPAPGRWPAEPRPAHVPGSDPPPPSEEH